MSAAYRTFDAHLEIIVQEPFQNSPRWWGEDHSWLDRLPQQIKEQCIKWNLSVDGQPLHGSNAIVLPVTTQAQNPLILRMTPPSETFLKELTALRYWNGNGTVKLLNVDDEVGAMLLERLDTATTLKALPLDKAVPIAARMIRRLADISCPFDSSVPRTKDIIKSRLAEFLSQWEECGRPFAQAILEHVMNLTWVLQSNSTDLAVNGDMHYDQILRGSREPWLTIDPLLLRGDVEYDLARLLWTRLDEMSSDDDILGHFRILVKEARLDWDRARRWVLFRTVDYWLWGLQHGLTEDPERCRRLLNAFMAK